MIRHAHHDIPVDPIEGDIPPSERILRRYWRWGNFFVPLGTSDVKVYAEVNHGRWVARCPWCSAALSVSVEDPRFFDPLCHNDRSAQWATVVFPDGWEEIEAVLDRRRVENRNWHPGESVVDLEAENEAHAGELIS
jgi:hypothetical protein